MSKKHFEALAAALKHNRPEDGAAGFYVWLNGVGEVADVCARFNPNFDRARFLAACGVEG